MMTDPNWIIQKINEWEERLATARRNFDFAAKQSAELEIRTYREWLNKPEKAEQQPEQSIH